MPPFLLPSPNIHLPSLSSIFIPLSSWIKSTLYTFSQRRSCQNKMEIEADGQAVEHSRILLLRIWSKTFRLKHQLMPFETNLIIWLCLSWGGQISLPYLSSLNYFKSDKCLLLPKVVRTQEHGGSEVNSTWSWFHLIGCLNLSMFGSRHILFM